MLFLAFHVNVSLRCSSLCMLKFDGVRVAHVNVWCALFMLNV